ncbi:MAG: orotate phosphoribosyltransferase-like protein [Thermoplasmata archaeon]|nr:MAG: orotate phosphoribosyltransferase-like protein [Thermoplasmata archaeon]
MKSIESLLEKVIELKKKGLTEREIGEELHLSTETITWLLTRGIEEEMPIDIKIGWRSVGVFGRRIETLSFAIMDVIEEEMVKRDVDVDVAVGIALNGIPYATCISNLMDIELAIYRPPQDKDSLGTFSSNYASVSGKNVVFIDDVLSTGHTLMSAIKTVRHDNGNPVLAVVIVNKTPHNDIMGVPLRALIRARIIRPK